MGLPEFSGKLYENAKSATYWLFNFVDEISGDVPNIGGNDGALVYALCDNCHRDFRPTVQLAGFLFCEIDFYGFGPWNEPLESLDILGDFPRSGKPHTTHYPVGGFSVVHSRHNSSRMYCRFPNFRFRPSQSDILHIDLWRDGVNILRDGGSYSYAAKDEELLYFRGALSHNTCQFDTHDQMPRLSRFLYGPWLSVNDVNLFSDDESQIWQAGYIDLWGCSHKRTVESTAKAWIITDRVDGPFKQVTLRWRLCPEFQWQLQDCGVDSKVVSIDVSSDGKPGELDLVVETESRLYLEKTPLQVLRITYSKGKRSIVTTISLNGRSR